MYGSDGGAQGPGPGAANTSIKKKSFREQVAQLPLRGIMSVLTMVFVLCIVPAVVFNLLSLDPSPLHWLVAFYLLAGVVIIVGSCFPFNWVRDKVLRWFLFLATFNGRGAILFMMGLLCTGMGKWGIVAGVGNMILGVAHVLVWLFFSDVVGVEVAKVEGRLGRVGQSVPKQVRDAGEDEPSTSGSYSESRATEEQQHEFGPGATNDPENPFAVAEAYQAPELDPFTNYAVAAASRHNNL